MKIEFIKRDASSFRRILIANDKGEISDELNLIAMTKRNSAAFETENGKRLIYGQKLGTKKYAICFNELSQI